MVCPIELADDASVCLPVDMPVFHRGMMQSIMDGILRDDGEAHGVASCECSLPTESASRMIASQRDDGSGYQSLLHSAPFVRLRILSSLWFPCFECSLGCVSDDALVNVWADHRLRSIIYPAQRCVAWHCVALWRSASSALVAMFELLT